MTPPQLDLREKKPVVAPPAAVDADTVTLPGPGVLPLTPGRVMRPTPAEEEQLKKLAPEWKSGDPVPTNLSEAVAQIQAEANAPVDMTGVTAFDMNKVQTVDIEALPAEKQQELQQAMQDMLQKEAARQQQAAEIPTPANPTVGVAIQEALAAAAEEVPPKMPESPTQPAATQPEVPPTTSTEQPTTPDTSPTANSGSPTGATAEPTCPHCGHNLNEPDTIEPTNDDKYSFRAAMLGGKRFYKTISLFSGDMKVTYRTLSSEEASLCLEQLAADALAGRIESDQAWWCQHMLYRLVCGLESIHVETGLTRMPALCDIEYDRETHKTALPQLLKYLFREVLPNENIRRFVGREFLRVQKMVDNMEARLDDENFWTAIAPKP